MLPRSCGCVCEFQVYAVDKYRAQRQAKFQATRCPDCIAKVQAEQQRAAAAMPTRDEVLRALPTDTEMKMTRTAAGWAGRLTAGGATVAATAGDGPTSLVVSLARAWSERPGGPEAGPGQP
jgi:hypothetical protein